MALVDAIKTSDLLSHPIQMADGIGKPPTGEPEFLDTALHPIQALQAEKPNSQQVTSMQAKSLSRRISHS